MSKTPSQTKMNSLFPQQQQQESPPTGPKANPSAKSGFTMSNPSFNTNSGNAEQNDGNQNIVGPGSTQNLSLTLTGPKSAESKASV